jgi:hypothetical protein
MLNYAADKEKRLIVLYHVQSLIIAGQGSARTQFDSGQFRQDAALAGKDGAGCHIDLSELKCRVRKFGFWSI